MIDFAKSRHLMVAVLAITLLCILWTLHRRSVSSSSGFSFDDLLLEDGKASPVKALLLGSFALTSWVIVFLTWTDKLTEGYFGAYLGAWVLPTVAKFFRTDGTSTLRTSSVEIRDTVEKGT